MKERPILFSGEMVKAIREDRKTQTRRIVNPHPSNPLWYEPDFKAEGEALERILKKCRYGQPGDRLWVRETWATERSFDYTQAKHLPRRYPPGDVACGSGYAVIWYSDELDQVKEFPRGKEGRGKIRPSIFMPHWTSRLSLEITGVRVERLQDISEEDAKAEGVEPMSYPYGGSTLCPYWHGFREVWWKINGEKSWFENPWCWVIEFRRAKA